MLDKFAKYIKDKHLFLPKDKILLAVSGGRDSMVMIKLFELAKVDFGIAHFNHKTRKGESDLDQEFVKKFAVKNEIKFYTITVDIEELVKISKGNNFQDIAREKRYNWLEKVRIENNYNYIATAHHLDDNIETFIYKLSKGSGSRGLEGINPKREKIVRPLLNISRKEIDDFILKHKINFREDSSNLSNKYDRNFIRHNIVPQFKKLNNNFNNRIKVTIDNLSKTNSIFDFLLESFTKEYIKEKDATIYIDKNILKNVPDKASFLFFLLSKYDFNQSEVLNIYDSFDSTGILFSNDAYELLIERKDLVIRKKNKTDFKDIEIIIGENVIDNYGILILKNVSNKNRIDYNSITKYLNADILHFPLKLRKWEYGDRFKPFGLKGKSKKVKDYFVDKKLSRFDKENTLLLINDEEICMIIGHDISYDYRVKDECKLLLSVQLEQNFI